MNNSYNVDSTYKTLSLADFQRIIPLNRGVIDSVTEIGQSQSNSQDGILQSVVVSSGNGTNTLLFSPYALIGILDQEGFSVTKISSEYQVLKHDKHLAELSASYAKEMCKLNKANDYAFHQVAYRIAIGTECEAIKTTINTQIMRLKRKLVSCDKEDKVIIQKNLEMLEKELAVLIRFLAYNTQTRNTILEEYLQNNENQK